MTIALAIALLTVISRRLVAARPLWALLPARLRWLPPAILGAVGVALEMLPTAQTPEQWLDLVLAVVVVLALAWQAGAHAPEEPATGKGALILLAVPFLTGCAGRFEEARLAGAPKQDRSYCERLDSRRATWAAVGAGSGVLAGAQGLASLPAEDETRLALAAGSVGAAALAATSYAVAEAAGASWARECSR